MKNNRSGWRKVKSRFCKACKLIKASEVHHIIARCDGGGNEETNLIDLCYYCHRFAPNGHIEIEKYVDQGGHFGPLINMAIIKTFYFFSKELDIITIKKIYATIRD